MKKEYFFLMLLILIGIIGYQKYQLSEVTRIENKIKEMNLTLEENDSFIFIDNKILSDEEAVLKTKEQLRLGNRNKHEVLIQWSIDIENLILDNGGISDTINMVAILSKNNFSTKKVFKINLPKELNSKSVDAAIHNFNFDDMQLNNEDIDSVVSNLNLPTVGELGTSIIWSSDNTNIISNTGVVSRPSFNQDGINVTLKASFRKGDIEYNKEFLIYVLSDESDIREVRKR